jgi:hypothetical protein
MFTLSHSELGRAPTASMHSLRQGFGNFSICFWSKPTFWEFNLRLRMGGSSEGPLKFLHVPKPLRSDLTFYFFLFRLFFFPHGEQRGRRKSKEEHL